MTGYLVMVRTLAVLSALLFASLSFADRLLIIPVGKKLLSEAFRIEVLTEPSRDNTMGWVGIGLGQSYDIEITGESFNDDRMRNSIDFSYNYTVPIVDFVPGISVGMQDVLGVTQRGRAAYLAVTYRFGNTAPQNQDIPTEFTFGFWSRKEGAVFAGVTIPLTGVVSLVAEHDSHDLTAGFDLSPMSGSSFRFMFRERQVMIGLRVSSRF